MPEVEAAAAPAAGSTSLCPKSVKSLLLCSRGVSGELVFATSTVVLEDA